MKTLIGILFFSSCAWGQTYLLESARLEYKGTHALKTFGGVSVAAKGKGVCEKETCEFLVAVPVKSFESGNSNRDLHMVETVKGAAHPMVVARMTVASSDLEMASFPAKLELEISGKAKTLPVSVKRSGDGQSFKTQFTVPFKLTDFGIERPSLLTFKMDDDVPVEVMTSWKKQ